MKTLSEAAWEIFIALIQNDEIEDYEDDKIRREDYDEYCCILADSAFSMAEAFMRVQDERLPD